MFRIGTLQLTSQMMSNKEDSKKSLSSSSDSILNNMRANNYVNSEESGRSINRTKGGGKGRDRNNGSSNSDHPNRCMSVCYMNSSNGMLRAAGACRTKK